MNLVDTQKFPWDRNFQIGILHLMLHKVEFFLMTSALIEQTHFEDRILQWFYRAIIGHYEQYQKLPTKDILKIEMLDAVKRKSIRKDDVPVYISTWDAIHQPVKVAKYTEDNVIKFCRKQEFQKAILEVVKQINDVDDNVIDLHQDSVSKIRQIGQDHASLGVVFFDEVAERIRRRTTPDLSLRAPVNILGRSTVNGVMCNFDDLIGGGLHQKQLGVWMASTGAGKTQALNYCAQQAILAGLRVMHYTLELSSDEVADRYDAGWADVEHKDLISLDAVIEKRLKGCYDSLVAKGLENPLIIKEYPTGTATVNELKAHLAQWRIRGWEPDVVVVDYLDLLKPLTSYNSEYADLGAITKALRGMAQELSVPIWSATQTNRSGMLAETVDLHHMGDSFQKAQVADIVITVSINDEEKHNKQARLYLAKNRNGQTGVGLRMHTKYANMLFNDKEAALAEMRKVQQTPVRPLKIKG